MGCCIPLRPCSNRSGKDGIKKVGGLTTGAHASTPLKACGRRSALGLWSDRTSRQQRSSASWTAVTQDAGVLPKREPCGEAWRRLRGRLLVTFDDQWNQEAGNGQILTPALYAELIGG